MRSVATCPHCGKSYGCPPRGRLGYCSLECSLWSRVKVAGPDECWHWTAYVDPHGYGRLNHHQEHHKPHRLALGLSRGRLLERHENACHACDVRTCCNPAHLWVGSLSDNNRDAMVKDRNAHGERQKRT